MAKLAEWIEGARPRTLPNAIAPVIAGTGAAAGIDKVLLPNALLALALALALIIAVNYANDYSDGIRGTDQQRVGPVRLVGSGAATPGTVRIVAIGFLVLAAIAGLALILRTGHWWMLAVGLLCIAGAWFYTGGSHPYGYAGFGELAVFVFFGLIAVLGTLYVQADQITGVGVGVAIAIGAFSSAVLVANNLRDIPSDRIAGKRTLAVMIGDRDTRTLYIGLITVPFLITVSLAVRDWYAVAGFLAVPLLIPSARKVLGGAGGNQLIPTLRDTGLAMLVWAVTTAVALTFSGV